MLARRRESLRIHRGELMHVAVKILIGAAVVLAAVQFGRDISKVSEPPPMKPITQPEPDPLPGQMTANLPKEGSLPGSGEGTTPDDGYAYVVANLTRAKAGDHRVQYHIGMIANKCEAVYHNYLAGSDLDPEASDWIFCGSFEGDPAWLTTGPYWIDQALKAGDPLAVLETANIRYLTDRGTLEELHVAIERVEQSGDPEALSMLAQLRGEG